MYKKLEESIRLSNVSIWNDWIIKRSKTTILKNRDFSLLNKKTLAGYDFSTVHFYSCTFPKEMVFFNCSFKNAHFVNCKFLEYSRFTESDFRSAEFKNVSFIDVNMIETVLSNCHFTKCKFVGVDFRLASLIESKFFSCTIEDCDIYGANVWDIDMDKKTIQKDLRIPFRGLNLKETISIDDLQLGNVIYLLLDNSNYKRWIDQSKSKSVLILGRFGSNLKTNISALKAKIRDSGLTPIVFDFEVPTSLDLIEAIVLLSFLSKFIIVDLTKARSVPAELQAILSTLMIPVVPIIQKASKPYSTFSVTSKFKWVLPMVVYDEFQEIIKAFEKAILQPATKLHEEIQNIKKKNPVFLQAKDFFK